MSSIKNFTLELNDLQFVGKNLSRPECVVAEKDGTLWVSDNRGAVTRLDPDGTETQIGNVGGEPNGLAMDTEGNIYIANLSGAVYKLYRDGHHEVILSELDGKPLGSVNFVFIDSRDRLWISVLTREIPWFPAAARPRPDGYIILMDEQGPRIVADGILGTNEIRLDADEKYLYAAETMAGRMLRFPVNEDGSLGEREVVGPDPIAFGGFVDGFALDAEGNLWVTTVLRNGLVIITPDGEAHTVFEDPNPEALERGVAKVADGTLTPEDMFACVGKTLQFPTSVAFGGPDLKTVYMGSLAMPHLITFRSPVAGLPLRHWQ
ncbi:MAG: SMP-30/gluconolactonase/LRE family protein [Caldilineae bacterium]|nr:MAG: SMP-30/gluconolactonase/LRE family protein [Caldilineae bacterium]